MKALRAAVRRLLVHLPVAVNQGIGYDQQSREVLRRHLKPEDVCVDVGCHTGEILDLMLRFAPHGRHYAFEPIPALYEKLKRYEPQVRVSNVALSNRQGTASFTHVKSAPGYSGFRQRTYGRREVELEEIEVPVGRLDDIVAHDERIALIKIDVEGAELEVLEGAVEAIRRSRPVIVFEHGKGGSDHYGTAPGDVFDLLSGTCALKVSTMKRWLAGRAPFDRTELERRYHESVDYYFIAYA